MATNIGPRIQIDGYAEYKKNLDNIIQQQKTLSAEEKKTAAAYDKNTTATQKNLDKQTALTKQIKLQEERVAELKKGVDMSTQSTGENSTETLKWKEALANAEGQLASLRGELADTQTPAKTFGDNMADAADKLNKIGDAATKAGEGLTKYVTAPLVGVGTAAMVAFNEVDGATDVLITKTGASGEALEDMQTAMENIATTIPTSFDTAANAVGEVNTRFGLTGQALEDLSAQFVKFAELNGVDVSSAIDSVQKAMASFGLESEDAAGLLDVLNKVGQDTGISVDTLAGLLVTNGASLRGLGMDAAGAASLLGQLEKSGVDTSTVMTGLQKVQKEALSEGITMQEALENALSSSDSALDIFGAKAGPRLYEAFQSGILGIDMFTGSAVTMDDAVGSVSETFEATQDPIDTWQTVLNELKITGSELGGIMQELLVPAIQQVGEWAKGLREWFGGLDEEQQKNIVTVAGLVAAIGPALVIFGKVAGAIGTVITTVTTMSTAFTAAGGIAGIMGSAIGALTSPIGFAVAAIIGIIGVGTFLMANWDSISAKAGELWNTITTTFEGIRSAITEKIEAAKTAVSNAIEAIKGFFKFEWSLPPLKLPHFSIEGHFSLNPPSIPHISVDWYRKAYTNPVMFTSPTVLATPNGFKGFGDGNGAEIVLSEAMLRQIAGAGGPVINMTVNGGNVDANELSDLVIQKLTTTIKRNNSRW